MLRKFSAILICLLIPGALAFAQEGMEGKIQLGAMGGLFRISVGDFDDFYGNRYAFPIGGQIGYAITRSFQVVVKGKWFQKTHKKAGQSLLWEEQWLALGIHQESRSVLEESRTYLGFGLAFFSVSEKQQGNFLQYLGHTERALHPVGFFLCVGFRHRLLSRLTSNIEIELTSAGIGRESAFEVNSIGGLFVGAGLAVTLF